MKLSLAFILDCDDFGSEMGLHEALTEYEYLGV